MRRDTRPASGARGGGCGQNLRPGRGEPKGLASVRFFGHHRASASRAVSFDPSATLRCPSIQPVVVA
jgi:hypothetical protein